MTVASLPRPVGRQREVLYLPAHGHIVVLGTAGSGKTTLAILRSLYLSDPSTTHGGRTLLVTFNRCLVTYMKHLARTVQRPAVDVRNYHHFARGYLAFRNKLPWASICSRDERLHFIEAAVNAARSAGMRAATLDRPQEFFRGRVSSGSSGTASVASRSTSTPSVQVDPRVSGDPSGPTVFYLYARYLEQRAQGGKLYDLGRLGQRGAAGIRRRRRKSPLSSRRYRRGPGFFAGDVAVAGRCHAP